MTVLCAVALTCGRQALVRGVYYFIGNGIGSIIGGVMIDSRGGGAAGYHFMYAAGGFSMLVWSPLWHLLMLVDSRCKKEKFALSQNAGSATLPHEDGAMDQISSPLLN